MNQEVKCTQRLAVNIPDKAPLPLGAYSHAVKANGFLFLSGQGARNPETGMEEGITVDAEGKVIAYDIEVQTRAVLRNVRAVLEYAGLCMEDLVDVSVFLADMNDFARFNAVYAEHFAFDGPPARTTVQATRLPGRNFIEIKAVAVCR